MQLHDWLDAVPGRSSWLAKQLRLTKGAVSIWRRAGVPLRHMQLIEHLTKGQVQVVDMVAHATSVRHPRNNWRRRAS